MATKKKVEVTSLTKDQSEPVSSSVPEAQQVEETRHSTPEENRKAMVEYLAQPEVKANLLTWATHLDERFHSNWFDMEQVIKKTRLKDLPNAQGVLNFLILGNLCHREIRAKGVMKYKITLNVEDKIVLLAKQAADLEDQRGAILRQIENLEATKGAA